MFRTILIALVLCGLIAGAAVAESWVDTLQPTSSSGLTYPGWIEVTTTATGPTPWLWSYDVKPTGDSVSGYANNIRSFTLVLSGDAKALASSITDPTGWFHTDDSTSIYWQASSSAYYIAADSTLTFSFTHPWGPVANATARALDTGIYDGYVRGPVVPEPMSILLGALGLGTIGGARRLRRK